MVGESETLFDPACIWSLIHAFPTPHLGFICCYFIFYYFLLLSECIPYKGDFALHFHSFYKRCEPSMELAAECIKTLRPSIIKILTV